MAKTHKAAGKPIADVAHPGKTAPAPNSKSVIIESRPLIGAPLIDGITADQPPAKPAQPTKHPKLAPLSAPEVPATAQPKPKSTAPLVSEIVAKHAQAAAPKLPKPDLAPAKPAPPKVADITPPPDKQLPIEQPNDQADDQAKNDASIQKLIDSKQYFLPINAAEKRRTKRFVALGIALSLVLAITWIDIALDAGLIQLGGLKPVTHFFST